MACIYQFSKMLPLAWLLLSVFSSAVNCNILLVENESTQQCNFTLTNSNYENFLTAIPSFENCTRKFTNPCLFVKLRNCTLPGFPNNSFTNLPHLDMFVLEISEGSNVRLLSPLLPQYVVFKNMKFKRALFDISNAASLVGWNWDVLSEIENEPIKFFEFIVVKTKIVRLASNFNRVANGYLTAIRIIKCQLRWLGENVLSNFSNLEKLELSHNLIEKFERFHLPKSASKLESIDLSGNRLQHLPADLFTDLPSLKELDVEGNNIKVSNGEIDNFLAAKYLKSADGIIWPCDCCKLQTLLEKFEISDEKCYADEYMKIDIFLANRCQDPITTC